MKSTTPRMFTPERMSAYAWLTSSSAYRLVISSSSLRRVLCQNSFVGASHGVSRSLSRSAVLVNQTAKDLPALACRRDNLSSDTARETNRKISFKPTSRRSSHPWPARHLPPGARRGTKPTASCGASAQVAQVFGTHRLKADGVLQLVELPLQAR